MSPDPLEPDPSDSGGFTSAESGDEAAEPDRTPPDPGQEGDDPDAPREPGREPAEDASKSRRRRGRRTLRALGVLAGIAVVAIGLLTLTLPDTGELREGWPERSAYMERWLGGAEKGERGVAYRPVPLGAIPESVRRAVLVSEDAAFYEHSGFDWHEIRASISEAWREKELPRGASTITQQLARNLYLSPSRNPFRKLREALITRRLESTLSKSRILELYLNVIEFGPGVYGVEAASRRYFGKSVSSVTRFEAAQLAATIPSPRRNNPATATRSFRWRARLAMARAFGGVEIDTLGPPPDTIEVEPPTLGDSIAPSAEVAGADTLGSDTTEVFPGGVPDSAAAGSAEAMGDPSDTAGTAPSDTVPPVRPDTAADARPDTTEATERDATRHALFEREAVPPLRPDLPRRGGR